jgi:hypothetical protein
MLRPTVSRPVSWNKAPMWGLRPVFYYCQTVAGLFMWGSLSLTRGRVCRLKLLLAFASAVILGSASRATRDHILLSQTRDFPFFLCPVLSTSVIRCFCAFFYITGSQIVVYRRFSPWCGESGNDNYKTILTLFQNLIFWVRHRVAS